MIGLIGPADSVELAMTVASEMGIADDIVPRSYKFAREATELAKELDKACQVLLFTGRVPYELVSGELVLDAELQFISHSGADLYRCVARVLLEREGVMPRVSVDSIDTPTVFGAFADLSLPKPSALPVADEHGDAAADSVEAVAEFHRRSIAAGEVDAALTCLAEVHELLVVEQIPVWRIEHTRSTMIAALQNAVLADQLSRSRSAQLAIALFEVDGVELQRMDAYQREVERLQIQGRLLEVARRNGGRLMSAEGDTYSIATNRGAIETAIERQRAGHASLLDAPDLGVAVRGGIGIGDNYASAEANARRALALAEFALDVPVIFPNGSVHSRTASKRLDSLRVQDVTDAYLDLGEKLGIGALSARRLVDALSRLKPDAVTAHQLADVYGVQTRSARRLLTALCAVGYASEVGIRARGGAGRPQTLYKVEMKSLIESLETRSGEPLGVDAS